MKNVYTHGHKLVRQLYYQSMLGNPPMASLTAISCSERLDSIIELRGSTVLTWALGQLIVHTVRLRTSEEFPEVRDTVLLRALVLLIGELVKASST